MTIDRFQLGSCGLRHVNAGPARERMTARILVSLKTGASLLAAFLCLLLALPAFSQSGLGGISGIVTDTSGAVVPAAKVEATNISTGVVSRTVTTGGGLYSIAALPPASYDVSVSANGFQTSVNKSVLVTVDQTTQINVALQPGAVSQVVTVNASSDLIDTSNSTVGTLITADVMDRVPLLTRDEYELVQLSAGVAPLNGVANSSGNHALTGRPGIEVSAYTINGANQGTVEYSIDGSPADVGENNLGALIPAFQVPMDAVQEFRVETQNTPATYSSGAAGVISLATKSGGNNFHGDAFAYIRPDTFNSNDYFQKQFQLMNGMPNAPLGFHRYQEGGSFGGPIRKNKLFFFGDYEGTQQGTFASSTVTVPTAAERTGDFSGDLAQGVQIYNPLVPDLPNGTRQPFAGNIIPQADLNPIALKYAQQYPLPNGPGTGPLHSGNYFASSLAPYNAHKFDVRLDYDMSPKQHIFGRYSFDREFLAGNYALGQNNLYDPFYFQDPTHGQNVALADDYTLNSTTVLQLRYSFTRHYENTTGNPGQIGFDITSLGFPASLASQVTYRNIPFVALSNTAPLGTGPYIAFVFASMAHDAQVTLSKVKGKHNLSLGFEFQKRLANDTQATAPTGWYDFDNSSTSQYVNAPGISGIDLASFLLGQGSSSQNYTSFTRDIPGEEANPYYAPFVQDDYHILPNLTLNLGLRWDISGGRTDRHDRLEYFDPNLAYNLNGVPLVGGEQFVGNGHSRSPQDTNLKDFGPRLAFSYQPVNRFVVRGGFGMIYGPSAIGVGNPEKDADGFLSSSIWNAAAFNNDPNTPNGTGNTVIVNSLSNPFPNGLTPTPGSSLGHATSIGNVANIALRSQRTPTTYNYNFGLEYQFPGDVIVTAAYVGSHGQFLPLSGSIDLNQLPLSTIQKYGLSLLNTTVPDTWEPIWPVTSGFSGQATVPLYVSVEPFPQFAQANNNINSGVGLRNDTIGDSNYNSLQLKVQKRLTHHFTTLAGFTWGKIMSDDVAPPLAFVGAHGSHAPQDSKNLRLEYSVSPQDLSYSFSWQASYDLPVGQGRALNLNGWSNQVLGGWTFSSILFLNSGVPLRSPASGTDPLFAQRVDLICNPARGAKHTIAQWFSSACFSQPANILLPGTAPAFLSSVRSEGARDLDTTLSKNFALGEHRNLKFEASAYNVTNFVQLGLPNIFWNTNSATTDASGFGQITNDQNSPRQLQFAARFSF